MLACVGVRTLYGACLAVMWGVLALICLIFPNKLFVRKDRPRRVEAMREKMRQSETRLRYRFSYKENHKKEEKKKVWSSAGLKHATMLTTANHGLSGRAGYDFIVSRVQSHKEYDRPEKNMFCWQMAEGYIPFSDFTYLLVSDRKGLAAEKLCWTTKRLNLGHGAAQVFSWTSRLSTTFPGSAGWLSRRRQGTPSFFLPLLFSSSLAN